MENAEEYFPQSNWDENIPEDIVIQNPELPGKSHYGGPRTSQRNRKPNIWKYKDFVDFEDEESHFFNFRKLDINHVRMNKNKIFDINSHQREYNRDHRLTVASPQ